MCRKRRVVPSPWLNPARTGPITVANVEARRETDWLVHYLPTYPPTYLPTYLPTVAHHLERVSASAAKSAAETGRGRKAGRQ